MEDFPKGKITPIEARLSGADGDVSLEIKLEPFRICIGDYSEIVDSPIRLDGVGVPSDVNRLEAKVFTFPINPEAGYIDGSIYFLAAHNPVDVTRISFGRIRGNVYPIEIASSWLLEFENTGYKNFETVIRTHIKL